MTKITPSVINIQNADESLAHLRFGFKESEPKLIHTDRCIWCGLEGEMSNSHLIPQVLGGKLYALSSCEICNNFLGHSIESTIKDNAFLTAALVNQELQSKHKAYRNAKKFDTQTGHEMHIVENIGARPVTKKLEGDKFVGSPKEIKAYRIEQFKKQYPNWPTKPLEDFFDDPTRKTFKYIDKTYIQETYDGGLGELRIQGLSADPNPFLIFKIAYEFLSLNGALYDPNIREFLRSFLTINLNDSRKRILFSQEISKRCSSNATISFREYRELEKIPFENYHYIVLGLTADFNLFVKIVFFGQLVCFFSLGNFPAIPEILIPTINIANVFPLEGDSYAEEVPIMKLKRQVQWENACVDTLEILLKSEK